MSHLERYQRFREQGRELHSKIFDVYLDRDIIDETSQLLDLDRDGDALLYDTEEEQSVHMDFILHEYHQNGTTFVERYRDEEGGDSELERELLDAMVRAETSLFRVTEIDSSASQVVLEDVLGDETGIELTDRNFSRTAPPDILLFLRLVRLEDITMTSGLSFAFRPSTEEHLVSVYDQVLERTNRPESMSRFIIFHKLNRKYGLDVHQV
ncbi:hypothetical protein C492_07520 [Natronococcus jeotgali DSM 18795]|uniref:Uncharacterized protein n=1 Tax=Natronococcus jeotgali DSM 18795 TaxID=1227498 RepID=L9XLR8_9EURY|nr:hypothetical protein C492_07520 [Natronococcus jeotgali DSM 18795]